MPPQQQPAVAPEHGDVLDRDRDQKLLLVVVGAHCGLFSRGCDLRVSRLREPCARI
ncbi:hypothetical protein ACIGFK_39565 [Streptomyces sp. NPDC085524]|uniref:hypothetical protein n=1 Tax=Streptomyces sp. NPDC085524 TaxID=3365728 RepID=UPI0037D47AA3